MRSAVGELGCDTVIIYRTWNPPRRNPSRPSDAARKDPSQNDWPETTRKRIPSPYTRDHELRAEQSSGVPSPRCSRPGVSAR
ncbi:unnamed protein product [Rangifer tarandus platyrhynchus]|uniref:Uncharacterized protein n=1 Tax=Rangifer tarandus platyrhynchus TaxID=3082113 RepID=A0ABN8ZWM1_RANTA|nr:unnamed protein product [Rangifer tarandus platyrhynchus]